MLKQRIITAIVLVLVLFLALTTSNPIYWRLTISAVLLVAFWEWLRFCKIETLLVQGLAFCVFVSLFLVLQLRILPVSMIVIATCLLWVLCLCFTFTEKIEVLHKPVVKLLIGIWLLSTVGYLVIEFKYLDNGIYWILCCLVAIWAADIGAYFAGKRFGKTKLAPNISPGKTVEGLIGGLVFVLIIFIPILFWLFTPVQAILLLITVTITALISVGGDLFESKLKRFVKLKDSSQVLPGHGGVLDRIDSLLAGIPFFVLGLLLLDFIN